MSLSAKLRRAPLRAVTGAYILNSGVGKFGADDETAKTLQGFSSTAYPFLGKMQPKAYAKALGVGEMAVGTVLLLPIVPPAVAGAVLVGFSGALLRVYWNTPGMHAEGNPRPTVAGSPLAKDVWMLGIGAGLIADAVLEPAHDKKIEIGATVSEKRAEKSRRAKRKAAKAASKSAAKAAKTSEHDFVKQAKEAAVALQTEAGKRARKAAKDTRKAAEKAQKRAEKAADAAGHRLADVRSEYGPVAAEKAKQARQTAQDLGAKARERVAG